MVNITKAWWESWAYHWPEEKHGILSAASSDTQMMLIPAFAPMNGRSRLLAYHLSNSTTNPLVLVMWDQYISDPSGFTTAGTRGSHSAPVWQVQVPASADVDAEALTRPYFQCGVAGNTTVQPLFYSLLLAHAALG